ncbi:putative Transcription initiation factor TFIID subunit 5 [Blattamonas nauphoetae]|uniref:Transcription initiation factor TFIID subunit 5 n=1 Tax=Blattamonas nauphoetae TaxID=2049346 RepID=A0ABQ9XYV4_9EUKA|nr:putative Transcription initiation factor TFIID subunit 5 [Blattamonas nauphoetae]
MTSLGYIQISGDIGHIFDLQDTTSSEGGTDFMGHDTRSPGGSSITPALFQVNTKPIQWAGNILDISHSRPSEAKNGVSLLTERDRERDLDLTLRLTDPSSRRPRRSKKHDKSSVTAILQKQIEQEPSIEVDRIVLRSDIEDDMEQSMKNRDRTLNTLLFTFGGQNDMNDVYSAAFSLNGSFLCSLHENNTLTLFDLSQHTQPTPTFISLLTLLKKDTFVPHLYTRQIQQPTVDPQPHPFQGYHMNQLQAQQKHIFPHQYHIPQNAQFPMQIPPQKPDLYPQYMPPKNPQQHPLPPQLPPQVIIPRPPPVHLDRDFKKPPNPDKKRIQQKMEADRKRRHIKWQEFEANRAKKHAFVKNQTLSLYSFVQRINPSSTFLRDEEVAEQRKIAEQEQKEELQRAQTTSPSEPTTPHHNPNVMIRQGIQYTSQTPTNNIQLQPHRSQTPNYQQYQQEHTRPRPQADPSINEAVTTQLGLEDIHAKKLLREPFNSSQDMYRMNTSLLSSAWLLSPFSTTFHHQHRPTASVFSVDAEFFFTSSLDGKVRLFSTDSQRLMCIYPSNGSAVLDLALSPDQRFFATGCLDGTARLWTTSKVSPLRLFVGHSAAVEVVVFHPNGLYVATGSADRTVRVWRIDDGEMVRIFAGLSSPVTSLCFSVDGINLICGELSGTLSVWSLETGVQLSHTTITIDSVSAPIWTMSCNWHGDVLAVGDDAGRVVLWDVRKLAKRPSVDDREDTRPVFVDAEGFKFETRPVLTKEYGKEEIENSEDALIKILRAKNTKILKLFHTFSDLLLCAGVVVDRGET